MLASGVAKQLRGARRLGDAARLLHDQVRGARGIRAVLEEGLQTPGEHLLEADDEHAVARAVGNHVAAHVQTGGAGGAVVVDVVDGDARHAELVEDALAAGAVAVAVAGDALVDVVVVDLRVEHGLDASFEAQFRIVDLSAGLDELGHAHAEDVDGLFLGGRHGGGVGGEVGDGVLVESSQCYCERRYCSREMEIRADAYEGCATCSVETLRLRLYKRVARRELGKDGVG